MLRQSLRRVQELLLPIYGGISAASIESIVEGADDLTVRIADWHTSRAAGSMWDMLALCLLVKHLQPRRLFEIGTGTGRSTYHFAMNTPPDARISTLDVLDEHSNILGRRIFAGTPESGKITQYQGESASFDFSEWNGKMDFVFVDGGHGYEDVRRDTETAFQLLAPGGCIIWDDFAPGWPGVIVALRQHPRRREFRRISGTKLVYFATQPVLPVPDSFT